MFNIAFDTLKSLCIFVLTTSAGVFYVVCNIFKLKCCSLSIILFFIFFSVDTMVGMKIVEFMTLCKLSEALTINSILVLFICNFIILALVITFYYCKYCLKLCVVYTRYSYLFGIK